MNFFFRRIVDAREGVKFVACVHMSDTNCDSRYLVLVKLLVENHVCNVFEVEFVLTY